MKKKVVVAMSGGVDSSVACAILKREGFDVVGMTLRFFATGKEISCCGSNDSAALAAKVCGILGVRHYVKDARRQFSRDIIEDFAAAYLQGRTPNPCVECNRLLKFDYLFKIARAIDADYLATGHYARVERGLAGHELLRGRDEKKDQSYFLYCIKPSVLENLLFPLGDYTKEEVRKLAAELGLPSAREKESRDICFIPGGDYPGWLKKKGYAENRQGYLKDIRGRILGLHDGCFYFTVGQRKNLGVSAGERLYVSDIRPAENEVVVSNLENACFSGFRLEKLNWLRRDPPFPGERLSAQIRYRHKPCEGVVESYSSSGLSFIFSKKQFAVTRGQSAVFYDGDRVLGGGVIEGALK